MPRPVEAVRMEVIPSSARWAGVLPPESRLCELVRKIYLSRHGNYHAGVALVLVYRGVLQHVSHNVNCCFNITAFERPSRETPAPNNLQGCKPISGE